MKKNFTWLELITGFNKKKVTDYNSKNCNIFYDIKDLYSDTKLENHLIKNEGIIEYIDTSEEEGALISNDVNKLDK